MTPICHGTFAPQHLRKGFCERLSNGQSTGRDRPLQYCAEGGKQRRGELRRALSIRRPVTFAAKWLLCARDLRFALVAQLDRASDFEAAGLFAPTSSNRFANRVRAEGRFDPSSRVALTVFALPSASIRPHAKPLRTRGTQRR